MVNSGQTQRLLRTPLLSVMLCCAVLDAGPAAADDEVCTQHHKPQHFSQQHDDPGAGPGAQRGM
jgi:hypothetical protein